MKLRQATPESNLGSMMQKGLDPIHAVTDDVGEGEAEMVLNSCPYVCCDAMGTDDRCQCDMDQMPKRKR